MREVAGLTILVTGAAVGIGAALAADLVEHGARVVLVDLDPTVGEVASQLGPDAHAVVGDITEPECAPRAVSVATGAFGGVDGLANVAGLVVNGTAMTTTDEEFERAMAVNLTGSLRFIRAALPALIHRGGGSIVNVASVVGVRGRQDGIAYVTAKAALLGLTRSVALDFGRMGVRCNSVSPGAVDTPMLRAFDDRNPGLLDQLAAESYVGRIAGGTDVASACRFLLSSESAFVNGADLVVDGGSLAAFGAPRADWDPLLRREA